MDALILDIMMPGPSGREVYDRDREHAGVRELNDRLQRPPDLCPA